MVGLNDLSGLEQLAQPVNDLEHLNGLHDFNDT